MAEDLPTQSVSTSALNLSNGAGIAALNHRVGVAVRQVCGGKTGIQDLSKVVTIDACRATAMAGATTQMATVITAAQSSPDLQLASR